MTIQAQIEGKIPNVTLLVSTAGNGLILLKQGILSKIIDGDIIYGLIGGYLYKVVIVEK